VWLGLKNGDNDEGVTLPVTVIVKLFALESAMPVLEFNASREVNPVEDNGLDGSVKLLR
jgi:hypothetical protein